MTTGAIYGNFKNRDELFIALGKTYWAPITPKVSPGATFAEAMYSLAKATLAAVDDRAPVAIGRLTGVAYALKNAELRSRVVEITRDSYEFGAEWLRGFEPSQLPCHRTFGAGDPCPDGGTGDAAHSDPGIVSRRCVLRVIRRISASLTFDGERLAVKPTKQRGGRVRRPHDRPALPPRVTRSSSSCSNVSLNPPVLPEAMASSRASFEG